MQAIVLAAGMGSRMGKLTQNIPKPLIAVNGKAILHHTLDMLEAYGVSNVVLVVGYRAEQIHNVIGDMYHGIKIEYVENKIFNDTNNIYSLLLASDRVKEDIILMEGDVLLYPDMLGLLLKAKSECVALTSPFNPRTMNGTVLEVGKANIVERAILKIEQEESYDYTWTQKTVNVYKFKKDFFVNKMLPALKFVIQMTGLKNYYELALKVLIDISAKDISAVSIPENMWYEVDDQNDLMIAERGIAKW